jgi:hypothetical protein
MEQQPGPRSRLAAAGRGGREPRAARPSSLAASAILYLLTGLGFGIGSAVVLPYMVQNRELPIIFGFRASGGGFIEGWGIDALIIAQALLLGGEPSRDRDRLRGVEVPTMGSDAGTRSVPRFLRPRHRSLATGEARHRSASSCPPFGGEEVPSIALSAGATQSWPCDLSTTAPGTTAPPRRRREGKGQIPTQIGPMRRRWYRIPDFR